MIVVELHLLLTILPRTRDLDRHLNYAVSASLADFRAVDGF